MSDLLMGWINLYISTFDACVTIAVEFLSMRLQDGTFFGTIFNRVTQIAETVITPTATSIIAVCFFIEFMKLSLKMSMFKWEYAITALFKFAIAKAALGIAPAFLMAIYQQVADWIVGVTDMGVTSAINTFFAPLDELLAGMGFLNLLIYGGIIAIPYTILMLAGEIILVMTAGIGGGGVKINIKLLTANKSFCNGMCLRLLQF